MSCIAFPQIYVQCHLWSCARSAEWRLKQFMNVCWFNSFPVLKNGIRNTLFYSVANQKPVYFSRVMDQYEILEVNLSEYICFGLFEVWFLNFSLKEKIMKSVRNQYVWGSLLLNWQVVHLFKNYLDRKFIVFETLQY